MKVTCRSHSVGDGFRSKVGWCWVLPYEILQGRVLAPRDCEPSKVDPPHRGTTQGCMACFAEEGGSRLGCQGHGRGIGGSGAEDFGDGAREPHSQKRRSRGTQSVVHRGVPLGACARPKAGQAGHPPPPLCSGGPRANGWGAAWAGQPVSHPHLSILPQGRRACVPPYHMPIRYSRGIQHITSTEDTAMTSGNHTRKVHNIRGHPQQTGQVP